MTAATARIARIARIIVSVDELAPALSFYTEVVGLEHARSHGDFAWLRTADGVELMLHRRRSAPSDTAVAIGFVVPAVDAAVAAWRATGGAVVDEPADQPWGERMAVVRDPDGHLVCLSSR